MNPSLERALTWLVVFLFGTAGAGCNEGNSPPCNPACNAADLGAAAPAGGDSGADLGSGCDGTECPSLDQAGAPPKDLASPGPVLVPDGGFTPGYPLPTPGNAIALGTTNKLSSLSAAGLSADDLEYSVSGSYGGGVFAAQFSLGGAYVTGCSGGHLHPDLTSVVALDFTDRTFKLLVNANGAPNKAGGWMQSDLNGDGELNGYPEVPAPNHPYMNQMYLPPSLGGGALGSLLTVMRGAVSNPPSTIYRSHRFDLATKTWARYSLNRLGDVANGSYFSVESPTAFHAASGRYYNLPFELHNVDALPYLDAADRTWKTVALGGYPSNGGNNTSAFVEETRGLLVVETSQGSLRAIDLGNPSAGVSTIALTGTLPGSFDRWVHNAADDAYYTYGGAGQVIHKLKFTSKTTATVIDITIGGAVLPTNVRNSNTRHYTRFFAVPNLGPNLFAWWPGGTNDDAYLIRVP